MHDFSVQSDQCNFATFTEELEGVEVPGGDVNSTPSTSQILQKRVLRFTQERIMKARMKLWSTDLLLLFDRDQNEDTDSEATLKTEPGSRL